MRDHINGSNESESIPPLFVCGAGISLEAPTSLPGTKKILEIAQSLLLPSETPTEHFLSHLAAEIQPEVFFEQSRVLVDEEIYEEIQNIWDVLQAPNAKPNFNHYLLVLLASHFRMPIITLNFDTLLERAADHLRLTPEVYIPNRADLEHLISSNPTPEGKCVIWKIHGCIELMNDYKERSIYNTMSQLSRPNELVLHAIRELLQRSKLYIVGYSGRDGDFFPELVRMLQSHNGSLRSPDWIDPEFDKSENSNAFSANTTIHQRRQMLQANGRVSMEAVVRQDFPSFVRPAQSAVVGKDDVDSSPDNEEHCDEICRKMRQRIRLSATQKEALLMCFLYQSGHTYEAYKYARDKMNKFQSELPPPMASIVTLYFARLCDWNSQYDEFLKYAVLARQIATNISGKDNLKHAVQTATECYVLRARSMLLGPVMDWPEKQLSFSLSGRQIINLALISAIADLRVRKSLASFKINYWYKIHAFLIPFIPTRITAASFPEVFAWHYYLDHKSVLLRYCMSALKKLKSGNPKLWKTILGFLINLFAPGAFKHLGQQIREIGAPHTQADYFLYLTRYGMGDELECARHLWSLVNLPVGHAIALGDHARDYMKEGRVDDAALQFIRSHYVSIISGSHLTALKALIGLSHLGLSLPESVWNFSLNRIKGNEHIKFFSRATEYIRERRGFKRSQPAQCRF